MSVVYNLWLRELPEWLLGHRDAVHPAPSQEVPFAGDSGFKDSEFDSAGFVVAELPVS